MAKKRRSDSRPMRMLRIHARLLICIAVGAVAFFALPHEWGAFKRLVLGWDTGAVAYIAFALHTFMHFDLKRVRDRAADQDEGAGFILTLAVIAAMASIAAIVALLRGASDAIQAILFALAALTILVSWSVIHVMFALHYAHEFYGGDDVGRGGGLKFPGEPHPDYWDFVYFSFVVGMTFQVSDVQVTGKRLRRLVVVHGIVSFLFNVAILAMTVNIGSQLIS